MPGCTVEEMARILPTVDSGTQKLCQIALATQKLTKPMLVKYVSGSVDGYGRDMRGKQGRNYCPET